MRLITRTRALGLFAAAASILAGCRMRSATQQVAIGFAAQPQSPTNVSARQGVELAVARLNAERPNGAPPFAIRTVPQNLDLAIQIATALRDDPDVIGVVGHNDSRSSIESAPVYEDAEHGGANALVAISPTSTSVQLSGRSRWVFRVCPNDTVNSRAAARFAIDSLHSRRAATMYRNDAFGRGWSRAFGERYAAAGGTVLVSAPHLPKMGDWTAYAGLIRRDAPDLILFPGNPGDAETLMRTLRASGMQPRMLGGDGFSTMEEDAKEFAGVYYISFFLPTRPPNDAARQFVADFEQRFHAVPDQRAALAYDAAMLIGRAVIAVGPDRAKVRDWIEGIGSSRPPVIGVTGPIAFDAKHDVVGKPVVIARVGGT